MVRMSDVLKKIKEQSAKGPSQGLPSSESTPAPKAKSTPPAEPAGGKGSVSAEKKEARISPLAMAKGKVFSAEENVTFYLHAIAELKKFLEGLLLAQESVDAAPIESLVEKFITQISLGNNGLLELAFSPVPPALKEEDYLYIHMVNVGLFSIKVGLGLNYEAEELNNLACEAFFHDVGMLQYKHLYSQPRRLTPEEYDEIKKHLEPADLIVDAMLGTGTSGAPREPIKSAIQVINDYVDSSKTIVALDIPSGLDCDSGKPLDAAVRADHTITFAALKTGFLWPGAKTYTGEITIASIGIDTRRLLNT